MVSQFRLPVDGCFKLVMVIAGCVATWYVGQLVAECMISGCVERTISTVQKAVQKSLIAPPPKRNKCDHWTPCPKGTFAFRVLSGREKSKPPKICFEDEILLGGVKNNFGRGMNIAIVEDNSGRMIKFIEKAPDGSLILMATFDDSSTRLTEDAKHYIEVLGSKEIRKLAFRGNWVFLGTKGFTLPKNFQREKIINSKSGTNRYGTWPAEIQIDGCFSPKTDYL
ncbi:protein FAM3B-like [Heterodontus francisci]|uniref:protein FAM3B-like n=1 Tax=Heterodontus francisci TaxID=7792 RepID=UPI00355BF5F0